MINPPAAAAPLRPQFLRAIEREQRRTDARNLRRRARKACLRARGLCTAAAIEHRTAKHLANRLRLLKLRAFYAQLSDQLLLVPIGGGQQFQDDVLQIKLDLLVNLNVLTAHGEVDLGNIHTLEEAVNQLDEAVPLLLDFTGVRYVDSSTVHLLFRTCDRYDIWRTPVALAADHVIQRICSITGLEERLSLFGNAATAWRYLTVAQQPTLGETATE